jgi:hypothetical protein
MLLTSEAHATVVLSNLGVPSFDSQAVSNFQDSENPISLEQAGYVGTSFIVGPVSGNTWNLDSATITTNAANPGTTGNFLVGIYTNSTIGVPDPRPGTLVGTLSGNSSPTTAGNYTYTATPGSIQLTSGQTY